MSSTGATGTGGVSYGYGLVDGWGPPYPETTGYCIPTFLRYAKLTGEREFIDRPRAMAEWELSVQAPDGGFAGGPLGRDGAGPSVAFDTGQVLQGWCAIYRETGEERFLSAAERAGTWLVKQLSPEGVWSDVVPGGRESRPRAYNARTSWALLELHAITQQERFREEARRNLEWTLGCQLPSGWFRENAFVWRRAGKCGRSRRGL